MLPAKYGAIKRAKAERDSNSLKNNINLYIICSDRNNNFLTANTQVKDNLKTWLSEYKILTDSVDILDAKIINLGIDFTIQVDPNYNKIDVRNQVKDRLKIFFATKPDIGAAFNKLDVYREIQKIKGVLDIIDVNIINKTGRLYIIVLVHYNFFLTYHVC
jgi:hypothetical protein